MPCRRGVATKAASLAAISGQLLCLWLVYIPHCIIWSALQYPRRRRIYPTLESSILTKTHCPACWWYAETCRIQPGFMRTSLSLRLSYPKG
ncbi:hypothetical protein BDV23DRAFT_159724 [Aspergillus alliaceus]|uniref:Uncharacterized protein n=1 Tax=Petromyces alliaceus TaxID=209559 RepID=A0A5N7C2J6_PETAA|nr:hypothetical protein BDV23DRAFT_159724 [Aspergillus alliaceus]